MMPHFTLAFTVKLHVLLEDLTLLQLGSNKVTKSGIKKIAVMLCSYICYLSLSLVNQYFLKLLKGQLGYN